MAGDAGGQQTGGEISLRRTELSCFSCGMNAVSAAIAMEIDRSDRRTSHHT